MFLSPRRELNSKLSELQWDALTIELPYQDSEGRAKATMTMHEYWLAGQLLIVA